MVALSSAHSRSAGRPSPIWASTLSVPMIPLASLTQAYWSSLHSCAPPSTATEDAPAPPRAPCNASVAAPSATDHDAGSNSWPASPRPARTSGSPRRSALWVASKLNRSRSLSQPWFTASESTPWMRSRRLREACTEIRSPRALGYVETISVRSQGRALKR